MLLFIFRYYNVVALRCLPTGVVLWSYGPAGMMVDAEKVLKADARDNKLPIALAIQVSCVTCSFMKLFILRRVGIRCLPFETSEPSLLFVENYLYFTVSIFGWALLIIVGLIRVNKMAFEC